MGLIFSEDGGVFKFAPADLENNPPAFWTLAQSVAKALQITAYDGIQSATQLKRTKPVRSVQHGKLVSWNRADHSRYQILDVTPSRSVNLCRELVHWDYISFIMFSGINGILRRR